MLRIKMATSTTVLKTASLWSNSVRCLHLSTFLSQLRFLRKPLCTSSDINPLFRQEGLPNFVEISPKHVEPAVTSLAHEFEHEFGSFEKKLEEMGKDKITWPSVMEPLEKMNSRLEYAWSVVSHLNGVKNNEPLRDAYQKVQPLVVKASMLISQSKSLYSVLQELNSTHLDEGQGRIVSAMLRAARNGGVTLEGSTKDRFNDIKLTLAKLGNQFSNNVLDSIKEFSITVTDVTDMKGLPPSLLSLAATAAAQGKDKSTINATQGPWKLTLNNPCFGPFMKYSENRELRERMYKAFITKASKGQTDNSQIIEEIRELRKEMASILEFQDYASLSLDSKMAGTPDKVWEHIHQLKNRSKIAAMQEMEQLQNFANNNGFTGELQLWDLPYWSEKQRQYLFSFSDEELRPYFPLERALNGLFKLTSELFGITIKDADGNAETWHDDVRFFKIYNEKGLHIASFFLDPYSRPEEKTGGAWMDGLGKSRVLDRKPVAYLVCNQSPPSTDTPSLMTFREVETLFHEFGHGLQHMLTTVPYTDAAGINNVEWDAVELPSQFMENWMYDKTTISLVSGHYQSGQALPDDVFSQICKARQFMAGSHSLRQLYFSSLDMELHTSREPWLDVMKRIAGEYTVRMPLPEDRFPCSFLHIFGGGYAAGYYSYKWAELMSADAFSAFQEVGLDNREKLAKVGRRFRDTVLALGGSRHPRDVFQEFRGREAKPDALLALYGLED